MIAELRITPAGVVHLQTTKHGFRLLGQSNAERIHQVLPDPPNQVLHQHGRGVRAFTGSSGQGRVRYGPNQ